MSDAIYNQLEINITAPLKFSYKYVCEQQVFPGWKIIDNEDELEERGYSQRDIEAMKQDVEEKYNDGDEILASIHFLIFWDADLHIELLISHRLETFC